MCSVWEDEKEKIFKSEFKINVHPDSCRSAVASSDILKKKSLIILNRE